MTGSVDVRQADVDAVLAGIYRRAELDAERMRHGLAELATWDRPPTAAEQSELAVEIALPVAPEVGTLLRILVAAARPSVVVEFGTSFGASLVQLAAELARSGAGRVVGTELSSEKARLARENLAAAGLSEWAEVRRGDARQIVAEFGERIDLLLLDGWKELYEDVLRAALPWLAEGALVVADNVSMLPRAFLSFVRGSGLFRPFSLPLGDGVEVAVFVGGRQS